MNARIVKLAATPMNCQLESRSSHLLMELNPLRGAAMFFRYPSRASLPGSGFSAPPLANPKELMARMGHDSERAALIYLHSSAERQRMLADEVGRMAAAELAKSKAVKPSGTLTAREPNRPDGPADGESSDLRK
jgi:hypothetical protein